MRIVESVVLLLAGAAVPACHTVKLTRSPGGNLAYSIACDFEGRCQSEAGRMCPTGYKVISRERVPRAAVAYRG